MAEKHQIMLKTQKICFFHSQLLPELPGTAFIQHTFNGTKYYQMNAKDSPGCIL